jgi:predicted RNase H-like HicB family nuclease
MAVAWVEDSQSWIAAAPDFRGLQVYADTAPEAIAALQAMIGDWLESGQPEHGEPPAPTHFKPFIEKIMQIRDEANG